ELNIVSKNETDTILEIESLEYCNVVDINKTDDIIVEAKELLDSPPENLDEKYIQNSKNILERYRLLMKYVFGCQEINEKLIYFREEYGTDSPYTRMYIQFNDECNSIYSHRLKVTKNICSSLKKLISLTELYIDESKKQKEVIHFLKSFLSILNKILDKNQNASINIGSDSSGKPIDKGLL
ncbi:MAG: hypothetical protein K0U38_10795, partial [Epsilonproteobacteria bacterium]|nr:hypothetical protein [Campylobacterota bacterium]